MFDKLKDNVDEPIVDILTRMNKLGYETYYSCCGYDYPNQGVKDHSGAYIIFSCEFAMLCELREALEGFWRIEFLGYKFVKGKPCWRIEYGTGGNEWVEKPGIYKKGVISWGWPAIRRALEKLERIFKRRFESWKGGDYGKSR